MKLGIYEGEIYYCPAMDILYLIEEITDFEGPIDGYEVKVFQNTTAFPMGNILSLNALKRWKRDGYIKLIGRIE